MNRRQRPVLLVLCVAVGLLSSARPVQAAAPAARYTIDSTNGTVFDNGTGLMWQRDVITFSATWLDALSFCEGLTLGGHSDWRLPSIKELNTLVDIKTSSPAIDTAAFPATPSVFFWSSSPNARTTDIAWGVRFDSGIAIGSSTATTNRLRCVR